MTDYVADWGEGERPSPINNGQAASSTRGWLIRQTSPVKSVEASRRRASARFGWPRVFVLQMKERGEARCDGAHSTGEQEKSPAT